MLNLHQSPAPHLPDQIMIDVIGYLERDEIAPSVAATFPFQDIHAAQTVFLCKAHVGKIVLTLDD